MSMIIDRHLYGHVVFARLILRGLVDFVDWLLAVNVGQFVHLPSQLERTQQLYS
jgi:hypothetical protein